ncbi:MAG: hypothetical protein IPO18_09020 [bacterium]|nr:hypothetical protein [bacterium]
MNRLVRNGFVERRRGTRDRRFSNCFRPGRARLRCGCSARISRRQRCGASPVSAPTSSSSCAHFWCASTPTSM